MQSANGIGFERPWTKLDNMSFAAVDLHDASERLVPSRPPKTIPDGWLCRGFCEETSRVQNRSNMRTNQFACHGIVAIELMGQSLVLFAWHIWDLWLLGDQVTTPFLLSTLGSCGEFATCATVVQRILQRTQNG